MSDRSHEELVLRRDITNAFHGQSDVLVMVNEVNAVYKMSRLVKDRAARAKAVLPEEWFGLGKGSPDLVLVVRGLFVGLEVKRAKTAEHAAGQLSADQKAWRDKAQRAGVIYEVVRSVEEAKGVVTRARELAREAATAVRCVACVDTGVDPATGGWCTCSAGQIRGRADVKRDEFRRLK